VLYTRLVKEGIITLERLLKLLAVNPRKRFDIPFGNGFSIWNTEESYIADSREFLSQGKSTPFEGERLTGRNMLTVRNGKVVYRYEK